MNDDPAQAEVAANIVSQPCLVGLSVLMEAAWVMRSIYGLSRPTIAAALETVVDIETVRVVDEAGVRWALDRYRNHRADLADMLHIVASKGAASFVSFEKHLAKQAGPDTPVTVERAA
ncbi:MAG: type II toxin-antitoxin system VapC family toxin [Sphingomonas sp.]|nr:type II toxin-antitoxin system VapC family toxin [Sphingomonas sp.]